MKILLVEDDSDLAAVTQRLLCRHNYIVDIAEDLSMARGALHSSRYEIVLLDRRLPDGDGVELIHFAQKRNLSCKGLLQRKHRRMVRPTSQVRILGDP